MAGDTGRERKNNRETGSHYERLAGAYLEQEGYEILEYNYRCKTGEIDIICLLYTSPATTGPANGPRPTSSIPQI